MGSSEKEAIQAAAERQAHATSYDEWLAASEDLDEMMGFDQWKKTTKSQLYDYKTIEARLKELRAARESKDAEHLLYLVRTTFSRNVGNMGDPTLYKRSFCGTKQLIEEYILESERAIEALMSWGEIDDTFLMNTLVQTRKAFGRTALVLSGGATIGMLHSGVVYELHKQNLLPKIISGSSAGSIFASILSIHRDDEIDRLWAILDRPLELFERVGEEESFATHLRRFLKVGTWIDSQYLRELMQGLLGDLTFQEAYNRTGKILNVTVSASGSHDVPRLLNYLTAPNVLIWSAVCASCSVPLVFASNTLMAKNPSTGQTYSWSKATFIDGSVDNDLPLDRLAEMFNVNHFIACQVNPHVAPLLNFSERFNGGFPVAGMGATSLYQSCTTEECISNDLFPGSRWWRIGKSFVLNELTHTLGLLDQAGVMQGVANKLSKLMSQEYIGDITIIPGLELGDFANLLRNPTPKFNHAAMARGRAATWPKLAIVRNHLAIELALDRAILNLRTRLIGQVSIRSELSVRPNKQHVRRLSEEGHLSKSRRWQSSSDLSLHVPQVSRSPHGSHHNLPALRAPSHNDMSKSAQASPVYTKRSLKSTRNYRPQSYPHSANVSPTVSRTNSVNDMPKLARTNTNPNTPSLAYTYSNGSYPGDFR